jgi:uncharacterized damage-inducible protein DinB
MEKKDILTLYDYNYWANARILAATERITSAQFVALANLSHGSLQSTLVHALGAEIVWRVRCQEGASPAALPAEADFPTMESLWKRWWEEEQAMRAYLASLSEEQLKGTIQYKSTKGVPFEQSLWKILAHVVNHSTQCRSEAGIALLSFGQSPGDLDMILYFRERKG